MKKEHNFVYAVRNISTGEIINKRKGNPFFISLNQAKKLKEIKENEYLNKNKDKYEVVFFELKEVGQDVKRIS